jgi:hypothetical protein
MKRTILFGTIFSAALAIGASAQTGSDPQSGSAQRQNQQVTVTGCLKSSDATASGAAGSTAGGTGTTGSATTGGTSAGSSAGTSARGGYMLTNAKMGSGASTSGTSGSGSTGAGGTGTTGSAASGTYAGTAGAMKTFKLEGGSQSDLSKYANSQVEVRGTVDHSGMASSGSSATGAGSTGAAGSTAGSARSGSGDTPTLRVNSVRQVAATCSGS